MAPRPPGAGSVPSTLRPALAGHGDPPTQVALSPVSLLRPSARARSRLREGVQHKEGLCLERGLTTGKAKTSSGANKLTSDFLSSQVGDVETLSPSQPGHREVLTGIYVREHLLVRKRLMARGYCKQWKCGLWLPCV